MLGEYNLYSHATMMRKLFSDDWSKHTVAWKKQIPTLTDEHGMAIDDCILCDPVGKLSTRREWQNRWLCLTDGGICRSTDKIGKGKNPYIPFSHIKSFSREAEGFNGPDIFVIQLTNGGELVFKVLTEDTCPRSHHSREDWISYLQQVGIRSVLQSDRVHVNSSK